MSILCNKVWNFEISTMIRIGRSYLKCGIKRNYAQSATSPLFTRTIKKGKI